MDLWLDDIRDPEHYGKADWLWVKTAAAAIEAMKSGTVARASLDRGYDVVLWLEAHPEFWPKHGVAVHSQNPAGRLRMEQVIGNFYGCFFRF